MNKFSLVLGVAAAVTLAGCKDPDFHRGTRVAVQDEVKPVETTVAQPVAVEVEPVAAPAVRHCACKPGTRHAEPCGCGAPDCMCIVEVRSAKPVISETTTYVVKSGDSLSKISKKFNVTISSIKRLNGLKGDMVRIGQKLKLPGSTAAAAPAAVAPAAAAGAAPAAAPAAVKATNTKKTVVVKKVAGTYSGATKEYVVKNGDTLGGIAYGNGINIRQLKALNNMSKDTLRVGQKLKVPADAKAAKQAVVAVEKNPVAEPAKPAVAVEQKPVAEVAPAAAPAAVEPAKAPAQEAAPAAAPAPSAPAVEAAPEPATTPYVVQEGDDITGVAIKWGVSSADIRELNNLGDKDQLTVGQVIRLPASAQQQ